MKTIEFNTKLTSRQIQENMSRMFGLRVNLEKYNREQLEDMRNKLRTKLFQQENQSGMNDLLTNETYQKNKVMLDLLNTRIKEMLGEDIKKLKDKLQQIDEGKKGVKASKHTRGSKDALASKDYDGDGKVETPKDEVWGSRAKAAAAAGKPFNEAMKDKKCPKCGEKHSGQCPSTVEEGFDDMMKDVEARGKKEKQEKGTGKFDVKKTSTGTKYTRKPETFDDGGKDRDMKKAEKKANESADKDKPSAGMTKKEKSAVVKKAKAGKDIGKPGKGFKEVEKAAKKGGAKDPKAVAAAAMWKQQAKKESQEIFRRHVKIVNESLGYLLAEDEEEKAKAITAASDVVNDITSWMQRVGQYQTKVMIELSDEIRHNFGAAEAEAFKQAVSPALASILDTLTQQRESISSAVAQLAGEQMPTEPMGAEPGMTPAEEPMPTAAPDEMNPPSDEFAASDAAAGTGTPGREMRENKFLRKLAESHSIIAKLAK